MPNHSRRPPNKKLPLKTAHMKVAEFLEGRTRQTDQQFLADSRSIAFPGHFELLLPLHDHYKFVCIVNEVRPNFSRRIYP